MQRGRTALAVQSHSRSTRDAHRHDSGNPRGHEGFDENSVTAEEKAAPIKGASELLRDVLNKPLESTFVVIEEVETDNWGWGGLPVQEFRRRRAAAGG